MRLTVLFLCALLVQAPVPAPLPAPFTDVESLRVQNVNLERVIVQRAVDDFQQHVKALKADLEKARPGWTWNPDTGVWTPPAPLPSKPVK